VVSFAFEAFPAAHHVRFHVINLIHGGEA